MKQINLYDYQKPVFEDIVKELPAHRKVLSVVPTGGG